VSRIASGSLRWELCGPGEGNKPETEELEVVNIHLKACPPCGEDVCSLIKFRQKTEPGL
jgi:hypothetical protein